MDEEEVEPEAEELLRFPARVAIDDQCDTCGATSGAAVGFGPRKPVICEGCVRRALAVLQQGRAR